MTAPSRRSGRIEDPGRQTNDERGALDAARPTYDERTGRVASDGQRIVDQSGEIAEERREIERNAERVMTASREESAREPSARFWHSPRAQVGPVLALLAGVFTLAVRTWPIAPPQGRGSVGTAWFICATIAGALYVAGFFLSDRHWKQARLVLVCGAILHLVVSFLAAMLVDAQEIAPAPTAMLFDVVPAIVALVAAFLITPPPGERRE
jgi:hypothetical protein